MNGMIIPDTPIAVDFWKIRHASNAKLFFLSHAHADHTAGLSPSWSQPIFCSDITARIISHKFQIKKDLIRVLAVDESHILPVDGMNKETMTVSLIDANHCPGAVIFLFEGYFGRILYTGDFRYCPEMFENSILSQRKSVDVLYLDNTYCDPVCDFPTREVAIRTAVDHIKQNSDCNVIIQTTDIGKEDLLIGIAKELEVLIRIPEGKMELYTLLELPDVFTTDPAAVDICVLQRSQLNMQAIKDLVSDGDIPTIVLLPTCLYVGLKHQPYDSIDKVFVIPYSDHSSYKELCTFVSKVKPKKIVPIVDYKKKLFGDDVSSRSDMKCFDAYLDSSPMQKVTVPKSVQLLMASANFFNQTRSVSLKRVRTGSSSAKRASKRPKRGVVYNTPTKSASANDCLAVNGVGSKDLELGDLGDVDSSSCDDRALGNNTDTACHVNNTGSAPVVNGSLDQGDTTLRNTTDMANECHKDTGNAPAVNGSLDQGYTTLRNATDMANECHKATGNSPVVNGSLGQGDTPLRDTTDMANECHKDTGNAPVGNGLLDQDDTPLSNTADMANECHKDTGKAPVVNGSLDQGDTPLRNTGGMGNECHKDTRNAPIVNGSVGDGDIIISDQAVLGTEKSTTVQTEVTCGGHESNALVVSRPDNIFCSDSAAVSTSDLSEQSAWYSDLNSTDDEDNNANDTKPGKKTGDLKVFHAESLSCSQDCLAAANMSVHVGPPEIVSKAIVNADTDSFTVALDSQPDGGTASGDRCSGVKRRAGPDKSVPNTMKQSPKTLRVDWAVRPSKVSDAAEKCAQVPMDSDARVKLVQADSTSGRADGHPGRAVSKSQSHHVNDLDGNSYRQQDNSRKSHPLLTNRDLAQMLLSSNVYRSDSSSPNRHVETPESEQTRRHLTSWDLARFVGMSIEWGKPK